MRIKEYETNYTNDYGFEHEMVKARQRYIKELIQKHKPHTILEIGCGIESLCGQVSNYSFIKKWTTVEPADVFYHKAKDSTTDKRFNVIQGFFEDVVKSHDLDRYDMIICSALLHEIESPGLILDAARQVLKRTGLIHLNVPNAYSLHRQIAVESGYIDNVLQLSTRSKNLLQYHIFDPESFRDLILNHSLTFEDEAGYFLKPFTHTQMEKVMENLPADILDGLYVPGERYPELASEIYINAKRS